MLRIEYHADERWLIDQSGRPVVRLRRFAELAYSFPVNAFVIASGPSTKNFPLQDYRDYPCIAMNGSILACVDHLLTPTFYICDDQSFARDRAEIALQGLFSARHVAMSLEVFSLLHEMDYGCLNNKSVFLLERVNRLVGKPSVSDRAYAWSIRNDSELIADFSWFRRAPNRIGFSLNLDRGYFVGRTIPYVALQLCRQMGSRRVFLIGVDLSPSEGRFYEAGTGALGSSLNEDYDKYILPSFSLMATKIVKRGGFEVFNMSAVSRIPESVIPKISMSRMVTLLSG